MAANWDGIALGETQIQEELRNSYIVAGVTFFMRFTRKKYWLLRV